MEIFGLPAHALIVHAAVVFTPVAALATIAFAAVPKWRYLTRWPTAVLALAATVSVWAARLTGPSMQRDRGLDGPNVPASIADNLATHQSRALTLSWIMIAFLVLTVVGTRLLSGRSGFASGRGEVTRSSALAESALPILLVVASLAALVWVVLTGDAGSRSVWS